MSDKVLQVSNLQVDFKSDDRRVKAVDGISFSLERGKTLGIVGESGSGKSITSLAVMGLIPASGRIAQGEVVFRSRPDQESGVVLSQLSSKAMEDYRGGEISMIFQEPMTSLNPVYTIGFQLVESIQLHKRLNKAEAEKEAISLLQEVRILPSDEEMQRRWMEEQGDSPPGPEELQAQVQRNKQAFLNRYPHELSGGQMQRVMIAMAIACDPALLIADEPTTALDVTVQATILELLRDLRDRRGMSIMFITHDLGIIAEIADDVLVMYKGKVVESGPVWQIFANPQHPYTKGLLTCRPRLDQHLRKLPTVADFMDISTDAAGEMVIEAKSVDLGAALSESVSAAELNQRCAQLQTQTPLLEVNHLQVAFPMRGVFGGTKRYTRAVDDVSFAVYPGETLGLVGESGCGKSTLSRAILRLIEPTGGQVRFAGEDVTQMRSNRLRQLRQEMQIIFQNPYSALDGRMSVGAAVMEPMAIHAKPAGKAEQRDRAAYLLDRVGLGPEAMRRYPHEFSGGQRQRICIARSLALNPRFIICDESVSALDVSVQAQVLNLLKELQDEFQLTYIFISHDLSVVKFMSDRILVMNRGQIEEIGSAEDIYQSPQREYTRQLIGAIPIGSLDRIRQQQALRGVNVG
jgi:peptide/nickel transport system ATP-binding protein